MRSRLLLASPSAFAGAVLYEPASVIGPPGDLRLGFEAIPRAGEVGEGLRRARAALAGGKPGTALGIFTTIAAGWPAWAAHLAGYLVALIPTYRALIPCQIDELGAMERLGNRLDAYSRISAPTVMLCGDRSPGPLRETVVAVADAIPAAKRVVLSGQGHAAHVRAPDQLARVIAAHPPPPTCHPRGASPASAQANEPAPPAGGPPVLPGPAALCRAARTPGRLLPFPGQS